MSKQRQRDRAAREAAQELAAQAAARHRTAAGRRLAKRPATTGAANGAGRRPGSGATGRQPVYRQRRFPRLPWRFKASLALGWLTVLVLVLVLVPGWQGRIGLMVVASFCLPLIVVIVRDPSRRTDR